MWSLIDIEALGSVLNSWPCANSSLSIGPVLAPLLRPSPPKHPSALARGLSDVSWDSVEGDGDGFTPLTQLQELSPLRQPINSMRVLCGLGSPFMVEHPGNRAFLRVSPEIFAVLQQLSPWLLPLRSMLAREFRALRCVSWLGHAYRLCCFAAFFQWHHHEAYQRHV